MSQTGPDRFLVEIIQLVTVNIIVTVDAVAFYSQIPGHCSQLCFLILICREKLQISIRSEHTKHQNITTGKTTSNMRR